MSNKNTSLDALKLHLFEALEGVKNLSDTEASACEKMSIEQAKAVVDIADSIIDIYKVQVTAMQTFTKMDNAQDASTMIEGMGVVEEGTMKLIGY